MTSVPRTGQFPPPGGTPASRLEITGSCLIDPIFTDYVLSPNATAQWSDGATTTVPDILQGPDADEDWSILSVSVQAFLALSLTFPTEGNFLFGGKFGKIEAGLIMPPEAADVGVLQSAPGIVSYPADQALVATLWDSASGQLPPFTAGVTCAPAVGRGLPVSCTILPPNPIKLTPGNPPAIGIWMHQTLLSMINTLTTFPIPFYVGLGVCYAQWTVNYDDGN